MMSQSRIIYSATSPFLCFILLSIFYYNLISIKCMPRDIKKRQKQYEYYREKLLDFPKK